MMKFIKKNKKNIVISLLIALLISIIYISLKALGLVVIDCPVQYLNPWQLFFSCAIFYGLIYIVLFVTSFTIVYFILKRLRLLKK